MAWTHAGFGVCLFAVAALGQQPAAGDRGDFDTFLRSFQHGTERFINGDPSVWKQHASPSERATLMGGWGDVKHGWAEVGPHYEWAARRFEPSGATLQVDYIETAVSGDLAYSVAIERSKARVAGQPAAADMALRVTHVFRKEGGGWKLLHRHADPLMAITPAGAVLK